MRCPYCGYLETRVLDSRPAEEGDSIRRRRECGDCGKRFTTYEKVEEAPFLVFKKDGRRELFSRSKVLNGLIKACEKRPIPLEKLEELVSAIERDLRSTAEREVASKDIGEMVMDRLRQLDEVAYVRFASVYRQFKDIQDIHRFVQELGKLLNNREMDGKEPSSSG